MVNKAFFIGEHSEWMINLEHVIYARGDGPSGGPITVIMDNGTRIKLEDGNADMFRQQWREYARQT